MKCPKCGALGARVLDSRPTDGGAALRRRRECEACEHRYTTLERAVAPTIYVIKKDGRREEFDAEKLRHGVVRACNKRPVAMADIDCMIGQVEHDLQERLQKQDGKKEVETEEIGALVMQHLYALDQVAYVRFASVYQRFDDVKLFAQLLERIASGNRRPRTSQTSLVIPEIDPTIPVDAETEPTKSPVSFENIEQETLDGDSENPAIRSAHHA